MRVVLAAGLLLAVCAAARAEPAVVVRWLGVAGFSVTSGETVLLHDPFVSRPGLWRTLVERFESDPDAIANLLAPEGPAPETTGSDAILIGHSHYDHLGDAPAIALRTGAAMVGSETTLAIAEGYGVDRAALRLARPGDALAFGPFAVRVVESRHARVLFGRVPLPGVVSTPPAAPIHAFSFKLGDARGYLVTHQPSGLRLFLLSSAGLHRPALETPGLGPVDLLATSIEGRDPDFARTLVETLRPRVVVPHHFDDFFVGLDAPDADAVRNPDDLAAFIREVEDAADTLGLEVEVRPLHLFESLALSR